jgi:transposase
VSFARGCRMGAYSKDLRLKVLAATDRGTPRREVVGTFGISLATLKRWLKKRAQGEDLSPRFSTGRKRPILSTVEERRALWARLEGSDEATLEQHCELWEERRGVRVSAATMSRAIARGWAGPSKKTLGATERDEEVRSAWRECLSSVDPRRLVFVDECSTNIALVPRYARAPRGERPFGKAPRN